MNNHIDPLEEKLGKERSMEFRVKKSPSDEEPFYLYRHWATGLYIAIGVDGSGYIYSAEKGKYLPAAWNHTLGKFALALDKSLTPCTEKGCNCQNPEEWGPMMESLKPWIGAVESAANAGIEPPSIEEIEAEEEHFYAGLNNALAGMGIPPAIRVSLGRKASVPKVPN